MKSDHVAGSADRPPDVDDSGADDPRVVRAVQAYLAALESGNPVDRKTYIAQHPEIAAELTECLAGLDLIHAAAGNWRETPLEAISSDHAATSSPSPLGDFRILREIGRGGMGVVYEAMQLSLGRRVALKVLPFAAALDPKQLQRFKNEAQAAAQLHHSNIVPVYAVGCERGVHFYAMQLIHGHSLSVLIRQMRSLAGHEGDADYQSSTGMLVSNLALGRLYPDRSAGGGSATRLDPPSEKSGGTAGAAQQPTGPWDSSTRDAADSKLPADASTTAAAAALTTHHSSRRRYFRTVANLGRQAAEALEHAHTVGVIHRDIKPANLLVDQQGNIWITDFGLAQFHAEVGLTRTGDMMGTLRYMSPEQALGNRVVLDHRTDIYSLGVTLYELLTLEPVFAGSDRADLLRRIIEDEPRAMRSVDPTVPVELETIVLKALAKVPTERYATAQELADDLQRFLNDEPIRARRPTLLERSTKWARRHRGIFISALLLLATATAGLAASTVLLMEQAKQTEQERARAEANFRQARQAVDTFTRLSDEELLSTRAPMQRARRRFLETALEYYQGFLDQHRDDPSLETELAASSARVSRLLDELTAREGDAPIFLFMDPAVQRELAGSNADLQASMTRLSDSFSREQTQLLQQYVHLSRDEREGHWAKLMHETELRITALLSPEQLNRLRQIALQQQFVRAFDNPRVVEALQLTRAQRDKIHDIQDESSLAILNKWPRDIKESRNLLEQTWRTDIARIVELLTPEQAAAWKDLIGKPFEEELRFRPPGGWNR